MLTEIAYSAVNQGAMPFGDTGIQSLFHDADNLGQFFGNPQNPGDFPSALLTSEINGVPQLLANIAVEYAGFLADLVITSFTYNPDGVITLDSTNNYMSVNVSATAWATTINNPININEAYKPDIYEENALISTLFFGSQFQNETDVDKIVIGAGNYSGALINFSSDTTGDMIYAGGGTVTYMIGSGDTDVYAGAANVTVVANAANTDWEFSGGSAAATLNFGAEQDVDVQGDTGQITVNFGANDTLSIENLSLGKLTDNATFNGIINGFNFGDKIDLQDVATGGPNAATLGANDVLTITESDGATTTLQLSGSYDSSLLWQTSSDGSGGTDIRLANLKITPADPTYVDKSATETFTVTRFGDVSQSETVYVSTTDGTTVPGEDTNTKDFSPLSYQALTFAAGSDTATFDLPIIGGDNSSANKTFGLKITDTSGDTATTLATDQFTLKPAPHPAAATIGQDGGSGLLSGGGTITPSTSAR